MRVLLISHTCQSRSEGQPRATELAKFDDIELRLLVPQRFNHFGVWREAETPLPAETTGAEYSLVARRILWPWLGPAQNYLHFYPSLGQIVREFQPDIIDVWEETWCLTSAHACRLRNRYLPRTKVLAETEQNLNKRLPPPFGLLRSMVLKNADFCVGRSEEAVGVLRAQGYNGPATSIPNAVNAELFRPLDRAKCREQLGIEGFLAGYVGRLVEEKGVMDLVEALPFCDAQVKVCFAGNGPMREALETRARELGVGERVLFLPHRPLEELPSVMNALDVLVLPSRTTARWKEQFGRVLIEAHACATPLIGSDSGAIPNVIGEGGLVIPEADVAALAKAIETLRSAPEKARRMGEIGRAQVEAKYTWARVAERYREIYGQMMRENKSSDSSFLINAKCHSQNEHYRLFSKVTK